MIGLATRKAVNNKSNGWGRGLRTGVSNWFLDKPPKDLAFQVYTFTCIYMCSYDGFLHVYDPFMPLLSASNLSCREGWRVDMLSRVISVNSACLSHVHQSFNVYQQRVKEGRRAFDKTDGLCCACV